MSTNPYEPPLVDVAVVATPQIRTDGMYLIVDSGAELPRRCVKTNQPISEQDMKRRDMYWHPSWVIIVIIMSIPIGLLVLFLVRKRCRIVYGLHPDVRRRYLIFILVKLLISVALFVALVLAAVVWNAEVAMAILLVVSLVSLLAIFIGNAPLRVTNWRQGAFWIKGCSREFLLSIEEKF